MGFIFPLSPSWSRTAVQSVSPNLVEKLSRVLPSRPHRACVYERTRRLLRQSARGGAPVPLPPLVGTAREGRRPVQDYVSRRHYAAGWAEAPADFCWLLSGAPNLKNGHEGRPV